MYKQLLLSAGMRGKHVCHSCIITGFSTLHVVERLLLNFGNSVQSAIVPCGNNDNISDCEAEVFLTENFLYCLC